jgi:hypothetical protein
MKSLTQFLKESILLEGRGVINANSEDHFQRYLLPHQGTNNFSHVMAKDHGNISAGSKVKIHSVEWGYPSPKATQGKWHVHVEDEQGNKEYMPSSKLHKPGEAPQNKGHDYESNFVEHLKKHGLMPNEMSGAGSTGGTDFVVHDKRKTKSDPKRFVAGKVDGHMLEGETKEGVSAAMGQLTIHHNPEKGWHISDKAREKRPLYAKEIEKAGIIDHMNKHYPDPHKVETTASGRAKTITMDHPTMDPAHAYLTDHHVKVVQVGGGFGTYSVGKDITGHGLPNLQGQGRFEIREKAKGQKTARTVAFRPAGKKALVKSHVNLENDDHINEFKKTLGHLE